MYEIILLVLNNFEVETNFCAVAVWVVHCNDNQQEVLCGMVGPVQDPPFHAG